jgi:hypothetical protein
MDDAERKAQIERFLDERRVKLKEFYCPLLRATISKEECATRHKRDHTSKWFGGHESDALAIPQDRTCNRCKLGRIYARRLGVKKHRKKPPGNRKSRKKT